MKILKTFIPALVLILTTLICRAQTTTFTYTGNNFQTFTAPSSGWYFIDASGAQGGAASNFSHIGGKGARIQGYIQLQAGEILRIAVGGSGGSGSNSGNNVSGGGGGGASSVVKMNGMSYTPLFFVAGGGGGAANYDGRPGSVNLTNGDFPWGGTSGNGAGVGSNEWGGGGGAGYYSDGGSHYSGLLRLSQGGQAYVYGNNGGSSGNIGGDGGWGGGGEGGPSNSAFAGNKDGGGGGGGGWNGGGGAPNEGDGGGGGGSFIDASVNIFQCLKSDGGATSVDGIVSISPSQAPAGQEFLYVGNVFQQFSIPTTGWYLLNASGGQGGAQDLSPGGLGASMQGYVHLQEGDVLQIAVGGAGGNGDKNIGSPDTYNGGGGGGASTIVRVEGATYTPLIVAGGGGGAGNSGNNNGSAGQVTNDGGTATNGGTGGTNGNGGSALNGGANAGYNGGGGAGYFTDGGATTGALGGQAYLAGNYGGGNGGWGGGGAGGPSRTSINSQDITYGNGGGGGGGGYSGGGGGKFVTECCASFGGGGGSYSVAQCALSNTSGANAGNGKVIIEGPHLAIDTVHTQGPAYTWPVNGATYQHSGTYYYADSANCVMRVLDLSIGGLGGCLNYTRVDTTVTSCGSYTNPLNGRTYTENTTDSIRVGCVKYVARIIVAPPAAILGNMITGSTAPSGTLAACKNTSQIFKIPAVLYATSYQWTLPSGAIGTSSTNTITVQFNNSFSGGDICVTPVNACGAGTTICKAITVLNTPPTGPMQITGPTAPFISGNYSVTPIAGATTYTWSVSNNQAVIVRGQGTPTIQLEALPGFTRANLSVRASNCMGNGSSRTLTLKSSGRNLPTSSWNLRQAIQLTDFTVFPNPSNGKFTLNMPLRETDASLDIHTIDGRLIYTQIIPANTTQTSIDLKQAASGIYHVRLVVGGEIIRTNLVVQ